MNAPDITYVGGY